MKRFLFAVMALLFMVPSIHAQTPQIQKSEGFDEPDNGYNKVIMLKNGNTMFFHFARKSGIEINVYNQQRKLTATQEVESELWDSKKIRRITVAGLYEISGEVVLFVIETEKRTPTLYRMRFNGNTGALVKEDELGSSTQSKMKLFTVETNSIFIEKDPESECYSVIFFNGYSKEADEKIRVLHFDGAHKQLSAAYYDSPDEDYKYLRYIGAVTDGKMRLYLAAYGANSLKGRDGKVYISCLNAGSKTFVTKSLKFTEDFKDTKSVMAYNRGNNSLQLLTMSFVDGHTGFLSTNTRYNYMSFMSYIDPETLELKSVKPLSGEKINAYSKDVLNTQLEYKGTPQDMIINKDNSTTIISEELTRYTIRSSNGKSSYTRYFTHMGTLAVNELNADGTEKNGFCVRKLQEVEGHYYPLYISSRTKGRWNILQGYAENNSYMSFDYVNTDKNRYVLFNDNDRNFDREEEDKRRKLVKKVKNLNTICYSLNGKGVNKFFLFGDPKETELSNKIHLDASDYSKETNTYATVLVEKDGRDRSAKIVWVKFN